MEQLAIIVTLAAAVAILFWLLARHASDRIAKQFQLLAARFDVDLDQPPAKLLGFHRPEPSLYGEYCNREISISVPGKGLSNTRQIETLIKVELNDRTLAAQITAVGMFSQFIGRVNKADPVWKTGHAEFDAVIEVRTNNTQSMRELLTPERTHWLKDTLTKAKATVYIGSGNLAYAELGLITDEITRQRFEATVDFLCDLAESIED